MSSPGCLRISLVTLYLRKSVLSEVRLRSPRHELSEQQHVLETTTYLLKQLSLHVITEKQTCLHVVMRGLKNTGCALR